MKKLLIPTDFSENAEQAYPFALKIAAKTGSRVTFWLAIEVPFDFATRVEEKMEGAIDYAHKKFKEMISEFAGTPEYSELEIDYRIVDGKAVAGILEGIKEIQPDWVVMGTKGATGLKKILVGSIASRVVQESPVPVLMIPNQSQFDNFRKIVFATDYQQNDVELLRTVVDVASLWDSSIQLIHISKEKDPESEILQKNFRETVEAEIEYGKLEFIVEYAPNFLEGIAGFQKPDECSLLVMGRYDLDFLEEIFDYSETKAMSFYSQTPLLVLPAKN